MSVSSDFKRFKVAALKHKAPKPKNLKSKTKPLNPNLNPKTQPSAPLAMSLFGGDVSGHQLTYRLARGEGCGGY